MASPHVEMVYDHPIAGGIAQMVLTSRLRNALAVETTLLT
jgi:hypothetical protein